MEELRRQDAQLKGDGRTIQKINDLKIYTDKYQQLIGEGFNPAQANEAASKFASNSIQLNDIDSRSATDKARAISSLTKIGGGGGVETGGGRDPLLTAAQRQIQLHEQANAYLAMIAEADKKGISP